MSVNSEQMTISKRRKLTMTDLNEIARLVATRKLTEAEAALTLDIKPHAWEQFKRRNKNQAVFESAITRMRGHKLEGLVNQIEASSRNVDITLPDGKVLQKRGDWRAGAWLAERLAPDRFAQQQYSQPPQPVINIGIMADTLKRIFTNEPMKVISDAPQSNAKVFNCDSNCEVVYEHGLDAPTPIKEVSAIKLPIRRSKATE